MTISRTFSWQQSCLLMSMLLMLLLDSQLGIKMAHAAPQKTKDKQKNKKKVSKKKTSSPTSPPTVAPTSSPTARTTSKRPTRIPTSAPTPTLTEIPTGSPDDSAGQTTTTAAATTTAATTTAAATTTTTAAATTATTTTTAEQTTQATTEATTTTVATTAAETTTTTTASTTTTDADTPTASPTPDEDTAQADQALTNQPSSVPIPDMTFLMTLQLEDEDASESSRLSSGRTTQVVRITNLMEIVIPRVIKNHLASDESLGYLSGAVDATSNIIADGQLLSADQVGDNNNRMLQDGDDNTIRLRVDTSGTGKFDGRVQTTKQDLEDSLTKYFQTSGTADLDSEMDARGVVQKGNMAVYISKSLVELDESSRGGINGANSGETIGGRSKSKNNNAQMAIMIVAIIVACILIVVTLVVTSRHRAALRAQRFAITSVGNVPMDGEDLKYIDAATETISASQCTSANHQHDPTARVMVVATSPLPPVRDSSSSSYDDDDCSDSSSDVASNGMILA